MYVVYAMFRLPDDGLVGGSRIRDYKIFILLARKTIPPLDLLQSIHIQFLTPETMAYHQYQSTFTDLAVLTLILFGLCVFFATLVIGFYVVSAVIAVCMKMGRLGAMVELLFRCSAFLEQTATLLGDPLGHMRVAPPSPRASGGHRSISYSVR